MKSVATLNPKRYTKITLISTQVKWTVIMLRNRRQWQKSGWQVLRDEFRALWRLWPQYPWRKPAPEPTASTTTYWPRQYGGQQPPTIWPRNYRQENRNG